MRDLTKSAMLFSRKRVAYVHVFASPETAEFLKTKISSLQDLLLVINLSDSNVLYKLTDCKISIRKRRNAGVYKVTAKITIEKQWQN